MAETIFQKLLNIQRDLKAPKGQYNSFGRYNYRNAEDIMEALKPLLVDNDAVCWCADDYIDHVGDRYYLVATIIFADVETSEKITVKARAREEETKKGMDGSQITGSASSYARKYALSGLFLIDDNKDADSYEYHNQNNQNQSQAQKKPNQKPQQQKSVPQGNQQLITTQQKTELEDIISKWAMVKRANYETVMSYALTNILKVSTLTDLPAVHFQEVMDKIKSLINQSQTKQQ